MKKILFQLALLRAHNRLEPALILFRIGPRHTGDYHRGTEVCCCKMVSSSAHRSAPVAILRVLLQSAWEAFLELAQ